MTQAYNPQKPNEGKLPIGIQNFRQLREEGYLYVDKTDLIWDLAHGAQARFIARPRRFGKSLMITTLQSYFLGEAHLFEGLKIEEKRRQAGETEWIKYPTFTFGFSASSFNAPDSVQQVMHDQLKTYEEAYGLPHTDEIGRRTLRLLKAAYEQTGLQAVILVDEYDNPLTDTLHPDEQELHKHYKKDLRGFYKAIKESSHLLRFLMVTGITQFSELSLFSGMNQLQDITLDTRYATLCGLTEPELLGTFHEYIDALAQAYGWTYDKTVERLRHHYDGYRFTPRNIHVYNPQSLIFCFAEQLMKGYWARTGTPALLATVFPTYTFDFSRLTNRIEMAEYEMSRLDFSGKNPIPLLYQTGYLTIVDFNKETIDFILDFPNYEVETSFWNVLLEIFTPLDNLHPARSSSFRTALKNGDLEQAMDEIMSLIAGVPYSALAQQQADPQPEEPGGHPRRKTRPEVYEELFQVALYAWFTAMGNSVQAEVHSVRGRADVLVEMPDAIYIFELKSSPGKYTGQQALEQIKAQKYAEKHRAKGKPIYGVGAAFDTRRDTRGDCDWAWEQL